MELRQVVPEQLTRDQLQLQVVEGLGDNLPWWRNVENRMDVTM